MKTEISFGKYYDDQRDRVRESMENKNAQLWSEWRERYEKRKEKDYEKELSECSERGIEISQECKTYYKKKFEWWKRTP